MKKIFIAIVMMFFVSLAPKAFCADDFEISSDKGEILSVEITPDIIYPEDEIKVQATVWNTSDLTWTRGEYFFKVEVYNRKKYFVDRTERQIGKVTIPAKASEIVQLRLKLRPQEAGEYYAKVILTLMPEITQDGKEVIQSSYYNFNVRAKESKIKLSGSVVTEVEDVKIKGDKSGPFVTEGGNIVSDATVRLDSSLPGDAKLEGLMSVRYTDDDLIDKDPLSIEGFHLKYLGEKMNVTLGDLYAEFTDLTLNESLEGVSALVKSDRFNITGVAARQWQAENNQQYLRYVGGIRPQFNIIKDGYGLISDFDMGFNYVTVQDDSSSLKGEFETDISDLDNRVYSVDTDIKFGNYWKLYSEYAKSRNDADRKDVTPRKTGTAFKLETKYRQKKARFSGKYQKIGSEFDPAVGFAIQDREEYKFRGSYRFSKRFSIMPSFRTYWDNLDETKSTKTVTRIPKILLRMQPLEDVKDFKLDLSYRERDRKAEDSTKDEEWRTYKIGVRHKIKDVRLSFSQQLRKRKDFVSSANNEDTDTTSLGLGTNFKIADKSISPSLNYRRETKDKVRADSKDIRESASFSLNCGLTDNTDLYLYTSIFDSDRDGLDYDSDKTTHEIKFSHRIRGNYDRMVSAGFKQVEYNYADAAQDYELTRAFTRVEIRF